jgi:hypothetical protein
VSIEVKVSLGDYYVITTQDDKKLAIKEAKQTIENEYGYTVSESADYSIEGESNDNNNDNE